MAKKKLKNNGIFFAGKSSEDVTGSQYIVKFGDTQILLECGLHQSSSNSYLDSYKINSEKFKFKPSEIDYVFVCHTHIDHSGLIPRLVKEGFRGKIIATENTTKIMKPLLLNCCYILQEEARILSKRFKREYPPIYSEDDVNKTLSLIDIYNEYDKLYVLNKNVSFRWISNSHCVGAAQLELILKDGNDTRKLLYTSDLGALHTNNHFVKDTLIPDTHYDIAIMESTYGEAERMTKKTRAFDTKKLETAIRTVISRRGTVILPCFSFGRTQELLKVLYDIFNGKEDFDALIYVDSVLSCDICKLYSQLLDCENYKDWMSVYTWDKVHYIVEKEDSQANIADNSPKIILSSSGFCTNGRVVNYLKRYLKDRNSMVIFTGYAGNNPSYLSYRIKNGRGNRFIKINGELIPNRADCVVLTTFSSHANYNDLVRFGSSLNTNKLVLVHGLAEAKKCLSAGLKKAISKNNKSFKVIEAYRNMMISL